MSFLPVKSIMQSALYKGLFRIIGSLAQRLLWAPVPLRRQWEQQGISIVPVNFYSNIPSIDDVEGSFEYAIGNQAPYLNEQIFNHEFMTEVLGNLTEFTKEFSPPVEPDPVKPDSYYWNNSQFSHSDAMAYYAMIRLTQPKRIVEIGSGFSTLIASAALERNGSGEIICVEPYPREFLQRLPRVSKLIQQPVQKIDIGFFDSMLDDGDILFIDSTHTVKSGSDCLYLYLKVIPSLSHRVMIHVHDVFLPDAMPQDWALTHRIYWTEQYLLFAYLLDNPKIKTWFGSHYHLKYNPELLHQFMDSKAKAGGCSFWFERTANP